MALRADMDALPIHEKAAVPFVSQIDGRLHACGHEGHTALLLGVAIILKQHEQDLQGVVKLIFQPSEEMGPAQKECWNMGVLDHPKVSRVFGIHAWPYAPTGTIVGRVGTFFAVVGRFDVVIQGVGGHGAMPHLTVDAILVGEDFGYSLEQVPGCLAGLGIKNETIDATHGLHHPQFKFDVDALPIGAAMHVAFATRSLENLARS